MSIQYSELVKFFWDGNEITPIADVSWGGLEREVVDVLHATEKRKRTSQRIDYGELSVSFPYDPDSTNQDAMYTSFTTNADGTAKLEFRGADDTADETWTMDARISSWDYGEAGLENEGQVNIEAGVVPIGTPAAS